jgi:zinc protease
MIRFLAILIFSLIAISGEAAAFALKSASFTLANGLQLLVIEDHRTPVVTHTIWYRVGSADEVKGKTGLAHMLEHVMFKGTPKHPEGEFDRLIDAVGGEKNAFTQRDTTAYYERVGVSHLRLAMELEADRMMNLTLNDQSFATELKVVQEERRLRTDSSPFALLAEKMDAALYGSTPYGAPVIGFPEDVAKLTAADALAFYHHYYAPANAIVVVVGDVTPEAALVLAQETYGKIPAGSAPGARPTPQEPAEPAPPRITYADARVATPALLRNYLTPAYVTAKGREATALRILSEILGGGSQGRFTQQLVLGQKVASDATASYEGTQRLSGFMSLAATPTDGTPLPKLEAAVDALLADLLAKGVTPEEVQLAKDKSEAAMIYALDQPAGFGSLMGEAATFGLSPDDVLKEISDQALVSVDEVNAVARKYLTSAHVVTGEMVGK